MKRNSLRLHLSIWLLVPLIMLLGLDAWLTYQRAMHAANSAFDRTLFTSAKTIAEGVIFQDNDIHVELPYLALEIFENNTEGQVFYRVLEETRLRTLTGYDDLPLPHQSLTDFYRPVYYNADYKGHPVRLIAMRQPVRDLSSAQNKIVWILVGETPELRQALARDILSGSLQQEAFLVIVALMIVLLATHRGLRPLRHLSAQVAQRNENDLTPLNEHTLQNELQPLGSALNLYISRLRRMLDGRRQFFADAAHQLKTPLAVIQAQIELALREHDVGTIRPQLQSMLHTIHQAGNGVRQLLSIARLEPGNHQQVVLQELDLSALARETCLDLAAMAHRQNIDLGFEEKSEGQTPITIKGHATMLQEMISNLLDNAIRYAGGRITVRVDEEKNQPCLWVIDNGPGVTPEERENVFKRFYRIAGTQQEGSGLGLAIVREIANKHHASVSLLTSPGGGLTVKVSFKNA